MAVAMGEVVQPDAQVPAETLSYAETEQQHLREYFTNAEAFFVERHRKIVQPHGRSILNVDRAVLERVC